jgi:hypothetical protein
MKLFLTFVFLLAALVGRILADPSPRSPVLPVLSVDNDHLQLQHADGTKPVFYELAPVRGVILDASGYKFEIPAQLKVDAPDTIQVLIGRDRQYSAEWKPTHGKQVIDASTLKPNGKSPPFTGFQPGDTVVFGLGHGVIEDRTLKFSVIWVGMAKIK